jgi:hypothetical protein
MSCGMIDSTIKVFWLNPFKVKEMLGLYEGQTNYLGTDGLKVHSINLTSRLNYNKIDVVTEPTFRLTINRKIGFEQLIDDANKWQII